jgi:hypothetical protein
MLLWTTSFKAGTGRDLRGKPMHASLDNIIQGGYWSGSERKHGLEMIRISYGTFIKTALSI